MIVAKTKMKKIPKACNKCALASYDYFDRHCFVTGKNKQYYALYVGEKVNFQQDFMVKDVAEEECKCPPQRTNRRSGTCPAIGG